MNDKKTKTLNINFFGDNLYRIRNQKGITIERLAEMLDVSSRVVYYWESGNKIPSLERVIKIVEVLGVSLDSILRSR